jgi:hypothetical protein
VTASLRTRRQSALRLTAERRVTVTLFVINGVWLTVALLAAVY